MKRYYLLFVVVASMFPVAFAEWENIVSTDEMTGDKKAYAVSPNVKSTKLMAFPYTDTEAWLGVGCREGKKWAYVGFSNSPNINNTDLEDGYNVIKTRVKYDDFVDTWTFTQDWGDNTIHFESDIIAIKRLEGSSSMLLELNWHGNGNTYFKFPLAGSSAAINKALKTCGLASPFHDAVHSGDAKAVKLLLESGVDVNRVNDNVTALELAVGKGHTEVTKLLLQHGSDINRTGLLGRTALYSAVESGHAEIVKILLERGSDINHEDGLGRTALQLAIESDDAEIVKILLEHGANVNRLGRLGRTVLQLAIESGDAGVVKILLEHGADVNSMGLLGRTALRLAVESGYAEIVKILLEHGADVNRKDRLGFTVLRWARNPDIIRILREAGASEAAK